jgi:hypothetical protein
MMDKLEDAAASQETPVGSKEQTSPKHVLRVSLGAAISFLITTIALGYVLGRINSPNWEDPRQVSKFITKHYSPRFLVAAGRQPLPESDPIELRLRVADRELVYRTDTEEITEELVPIRDLHQTRQSKDNQSLIQTAGALGASAAGLLTNVRVSLGNSLVKVRNGKIIGVAAAAAVVGVGAAWGYYMGFSGEPDYSSKPFQEMRHDKVVWRGLAAQYRSAAISQAASRAAPSATP